MNRKRRLLAGTTGLLAAIVGISDLSLAQVRAEPGLAIHYMHSAAPLSAQTGIGLTGSVALRLSGSFGVSLAVDGTQLRVNDVLTFCTPGPDDGCLESPARETMLGLSLGADLYAPTGSEVRPFLSIGPAYRRSTRDRIGRRQGWFTPNVEGGFRAAGGRTLWSASVRWRRVDRWSSIGPYDEFSLMIGTRPGARF